MWSKRRAVGGEVAVVVVVEGQGWGERLRSWEALRNGCSSCRAEARNSAAFALKLCTSAGADGRSIVSDGFVCGAAWEFAELGCTLAVDDHGVSSVGGVGEGVGEGAGERRAGD